MITLITLLQNEGPCLSSRLAELLVTAQSISPESARKMISRAVRSGDISSIKNVFPKREHFVYCSGSYGSETFWNSLTSELIRSGSAIGLALSALAARGGIVPVEHFGAASGSPLAMKKKLSFRTVYERLISIGLCREITLPGVGDCIALKERDEKRYDHVSRQVKGRLVTEAVFIAALVQWAQNLNLVSYDSVRTRSDGAAEMAAVSNYLFDITAPSYLSPLLTATPSGSKPGFFACDVLLGSVVTLTQAQPFIAKCKSLRSLSNVGRTLFIFAASKFEKEAFHELKRYGIIPATPENLFGMEVSRSLHELNQFLDFYFDRASGNTEKIDSIMTSLAHIQGASAQLQGALFEYLVAEIVRQEGGDVEIGRICKAQNGKKAESDVCVKIRHREVRYIECKGYKPYSEVRHEDIRHWIGHQIPVFRDQARSDYPDARVIVELWTTGKLSAESRGALDQVIKDNEIRRRCEIRVLEAHDVRQQFLDSRNKYLIAVFEKHFAKTYFAKTSRPEVYEAYRLAGGPDYIFEDLG